jgi:hypothetical protein
MQHQVAAQPVRPAITLPKPTPQPTCGPPVDLVGRFMSIIRPFHACPV